MSTNAPPPLLPASSSASVKGQPKEPFSHQAAKFSAYSPFILFLLGGCLQVQLRTHAGTDTGVQLAFVLGGLFILTTAIAFALAIVGICGGVARRAIWTIAQATAGIALNAGLLTLWGTAIVTLLTRPAAPAPAPAPAPQPEPANAWTTVTLEPHRMNIDFPGNAKKKINTVVGDQATVNQTQFSSNDQIATYLAILSTKTGESDVPRDAAATAKYLDAALESWAHRVNGHTLQHKSTMLGERAGRELKFEFKPGINNRAGEPMLGFAIGRAYLEDESIVTVGVILDKRDFDQDAEDVKTRITRFFDSLKAE